MQGCEDRSPSQIYQELAVYQKSVPNKNAWGTVKSSQYGNKGKQQAEKKESFVVSKLVLVISNWGFVRDQEGAAKFKKCTPHDVSIGLKLDSTAFRPADKSVVKSHYFDRNGASIPYPAFLSLLKDPDFTGSYMKNVQKRFEEDTGRDLKKETYPTGAEGKKPKQGKSAISARAFRKKYAEQFPELAVLQESDEDEEQSEEEDDSDDARLLSDSDAAGEEDDAAAAAAALAALTGKEVDPAVESVAGEAEVSRATERSGKKRVAKNSKEDSAPAKVTKAR